MGLSSGGIGKAGWHTYVIFEKRGVSMRRMYEWRKILLG